jgi:hypothetical protein
MTTLHLLKSLEHFFEAFHHNDPKAWIVMVPVICFLVVIFASFFSHWI